MVGDPAAIPALEHHLSSEGAASVQTQLKATIAALKGGPGASAPAAANAPPRGKWIVEFGTMRNATTVRGDQLAQVLRSSAAARAATIPGAVVVPDATSAAREAQTQRIPVFLFDGQVTRLARQAQSGGQIGISAAVEFTVRKVPEHVLKASLTGAATSIGTVASVTTPQRMSALEDQAVDGAVESALRGADRGLALAAQ
jgi:hypothetical protein